MAMERVIGFLSKLLIFTFKDEAVEAHGDVLLAVHLKSSISKPPYICPMFSKLVSKKKRLDLRNPIKHPIAM